MDKLTKEYRKSEFEVLGISNCYGYAPSIQIVTSYGKTKYIEISHKELNSIIELLTKGE